MMAKRNNKATLILINMVTNKIIGYYALTEADLIELDGAKYLSANPQYTKKDLGVSLDKWGINIPEVNEVPEWL